MCCALGVVGDRGGLTLGGVKPPLFLPAGSNLFDAAYRYIDKRPSLPPCPDLPPSGRFIRLLVIQGIPGNIHTGQGSHADPQNSDLLLATGLIPMPQIPLENRAHPLPSYALRAYPSAGLSPCFSPSEQSRVPEKPKKQFTLFIYLVSNTYRIICVRCQKVMARPPPPPPPLPYIKNGRVVAPGSRGLSPQPLPLVRPEIRREWRAMTFWHLTHLTPQLVADSALCEISFDPELSIIEPRSKHLGFRVREAVKSFLGRSKFTASTELCGLAKGRFVLLTFSRNMRESKFRYRIIGRRQIY